MTATHLQQSNRNDNSKVSSGATPQRRPPRPSTSLTPSKHFRTYTILLIRLGPRKRPVLDGVQTAAIQRILNKSNRLPILGTKHAQPLVIQQALDRRRRKHILKQQRREDSRQEPLESLQDRGAEAVEGVGRVVRGVQERRVDVRVEEGDDGEQDGEDGDGGIDGEGEVGAVEVDDAGDGFV